MIHISQYLLNLLRLLVSHFVFFQLILVLPGQIYFGIALLTQLGELISCPLYVILYGFNATRFKELQSILCFKKSDNQYTEDIQLEVQKAIKEVDDNNNNMD